MEELQKIEMKEKRIRKNIHELDIKQKNLKRASKSVNKTMTKQKPVISRSLEKSNKMINKTLPTVKDKSVSPRKK